ncbi:hypothetical protein BDP55DRAFT_88660 [Colletotrichum godetiae]|uniref:Uncharacterized protein n=1 Tax=Colletotrichum godetiae TaxID=1209918 RepID=A0AAJ0AQE6_9PEZI|nr:uncharacterized protein BDP55DRAFT_88660 [Colletotrichum godetiae]KAK1687833.1 hypothetical protein BDP55DRAFT_88660 [Colletotrichum godetiae]
MVPLPVLSCPSGRKRGDGPETVRSTGRCGPVGEGQQTAKQERERESARDSETVQIVRTVLRVRVVCVRCPHPHQSARHPRVHVPSYMGARGREQTTLRSLPGLGPHLPPTIDRQSLPLLARSCRSFSSSVSLYVLSLLPPSLPPPTPPPPPDRRAFSASSPFARFIYPPVDFSLFFQPLSLSSPIWLLKKLSLTLTPTHCSLSRSIITSDAHLATIGFRPASADPSRSVYKRPHTGSSHRHPSGSA